jgi:WD40 repeat protein
MWDIRWKSSIYTWNDDGIVVNSLKFSPDDQWIAFGGRDGLVNVDAMILIWESGLSSWQGQRFFLLSNLLIDSGAQECTGPLFGGYWGLSPSHQVMKLILHLHLVLRLRFC